MATQTMTPTMPTSAEIQRAVDLREAQTDIKNIYTWLRVIFAGILLLITAHVGTWAWMDTKFDRMNSKMDARFELMDAKFEQMDARLDRMEREMNAKLDRILREQRQQ